MIVGDNTRYLDKEVHCATCGIEFNPSKDIEMLEDLKVPPMCANVWCGRECMEKYMEFTMKNRHDSGKCNLPDKCIEGWTYTHYCKLKGKCKNCKDYE